MQRGYGQLIQTTWTSQVEATLWRNEMQRNATQRNATRPIRYYRYLTQNHNSKQYFNEMRRSDASKEW